MLRHRRCEESRWLRDDEAISRTGRQTARHFSPFGRSPYREIATALLRRASQRRGESGQTLVLTILFLTAGFLLIVPLLPFLSSTLQANFSQREQRMKALAAEAGVIRVMADLARGADGISTTYTTYSPHQEGHSYTTFYINTSYTAPTVTLHGYTPTITIAAGPAGSAPASQQNYVDPGTANPDFASLPANYAYLVRLVNVKAGTLQVNWAYSPQGISRIGFWDGLPEDPSTGQPFAPGRIDRWPTEQPILDTGHTPSNVTYNRTNAVVIGPGVYSVVFDNTRGTVDKTTAPFAASGGATDTWIYVNAYRDYLVTSAVGDVQVQSYIRQVPGYSQPPSTAWSTSNVSWITNSVFPYSWIVP